MNSKYYGENPGQGSSKVIFLGSIQVLLGFAAIAFATATNLIAAIVTLGLVLVVSGLGEIIYGVQGRYQGQTWPHVTFGAMAFICGGLVLINPVENTLGFILMGSFLLVGLGIAKLVGAVAERSSGWLWYAANGVISLVLGGMILQIFPVSAFWTVGVFVGIDLVATGATLIGLGLTSRRARSQFVGIGQSYPTLNPEPRPRDLDRDEHPLH